MSKSQEEINKAIFTKLVQLQEQGEAFAKILDAHNDSIGTCSKILDTHSKSFKALTQSVMLLGQHKKQEADDA